MSKIIDCQQNTPEWFRARVGIPTASEFSTLVTAKTRKPSTGEGVRSYGAKKLAERWLGRPVDTFVGSFAMEQGSILEDEAIPAFELDTGLEGKRVGFVLSDCGRFGCSPDLLLHGSGVEAKCPRPETHVGYLLKGVCPDDYFAQCQGGILVTGFPHWWFVSYARGFPLLVVKVMRDAEYQQVLAESLDSFCDDLDANYRRLVEINGADPRQKSKALIELEQYFELSTEEK